MLYLFFRNIGLFLKQFTIWVFICWVRHFVLPNVVVVVYNIPRRETIAALVATARIKLLNIPCLNFWSAVADALGGVDVGVAGVVAQTEVKTFETAILKRKV